MNPERPLVRQLLGEAQRRLRTGDNPVPEGWGEQPATPECVRVWCTGCGASTLLEREVAEQSLPMMSDHLVADGCPACGDSYEGLHTAESEER